MLVCHPEQFILFLPQATAAKCLRDALAKSFVTHTEGPAYGVAEDKIGEWAHYHWVITTRNPYSRVVSFWQRSPNPGPNLEDFLRQSNPVPGIVEVFHPVLARLDSVIRFESFAADTARLPFLLNTRYDLTHTNKSTYLQPWRSYHTAWTRDFTAEHYRDDFEYFDYSLEFPV